LDQRVQGKMQKELDEVTGTNRDNIISYSERSHLPYINAVINETQRLANILPTNLFRKTTRDVEICGHKIAKGTVIVPQIGSVMFDPRYFPEPQRFLPERFLDEYGKLKKCDELIPFSVGKRQCLGESLARMNLFLFAANFFHKFKVFPVDPLKPPTSAKQMGFGVLPTPYKCRVEVRK